MMKNKSKMLITGISGLLGNNLAHYFKDKYAILGLYNSHPVTIDGVLTAQCDLADPNSIKPIISGFSPQIIIHCASLTDIDACEKNREKTRIINVDATQHIVEESIAKDIRLVYISSDSVYEGTKGTYSEDDTVLPQNYYGQSKYDGEVEVGKAKTSLIFRTNIFGWNIQKKKSLAEWIVGELEANKKVQGFKDAYFSSIYTMELARIIHMALAKNLSGVYNCGSSNRCSKYEFATRIAERFGFDKRLIKPISIDDFNFSAPRGKNLDLNVVKLQQALDYPLPSIDHSVEVFYRDYKCELPRHLRNGQSAFPDNSTLIPYGRQWIDSADVQAVITVLQSSKITQGPNVEEFESAIAAYCGTKYAVAVNSGTSALHIACLAAGVGPENQVITSPITFVASANCVVYCGGTPVFADIDPKTYNLAPKEIEKKITEKTKALIPVHFAGQSCDMASIAKIVRKAEKRYHHKICVIEDASHALGSMYKETPVGSCAFADMVTMSFHPVKHITTGEGGVVLTNDRDLCRRLKRFRSHGITNTPEELVNADEGFASIKNSNSKIMNPWYYEQQSIGYNYRLTNIQAALGCSQLKRLDAFKKRRRDIVKRYNHEFSGLDHVRTPYESDLCNSNFHLYVLLFNFDKIGRSRAGCMQELKNRGVQTQVHYIPVHTQPFFQQRFKTRWGDCPRAENYYRQCLSIPLFPAMGKDDIEIIIREVIRISQPAQ